VLYNAANAPLWATGTNANPGAYLILASGGQLTVSTPSGTPLWGGTGTLVPGERLTAGRSIVSPVGGYSLSVQADGNVVEYGPTNNVVWALGTTAGSYLIMQTDGNLVLYNAANAPLWATGTNANPGSYLTLADSGELTVDAPSQAALWEAP